MHLLEFIEDDVAAVTRNCNTILLYSAQVLYFRSLDDLMEFLMTQTLKKKNIEAVIVNINITYNSGVTFPTYTDMQRQTNLD